MKLIGKACLIVAMLASTLKLVALGWDKTAICAGVLTFVVSLFTDDDLRFRAP